MIFALQQEAPGSSKHEAQTPHQRDRRRSKPTVHSTWAKAPGGAGCAARVQGTYHQGKGSRNSPWNVPPGMCEGHATVHETYNHEAQDSSWGYTQHVESTGDITYQSSSSWVVDSATTEKVHESEMYWELAGPQLVGLYPGPPSWSWRKHLTTHSLDVFLIPFYWKKKT